MVIHLLNNKQITVIITYLIWSSSHQTKTEGMEGRKLGRIYIHLGHIKVFQSQNFEKNCSEYLYLVD